MKCAVETCERAKHCREYCEPHYRRLHRLGDVHADVPIGDLQKKPRAVCVCVVCEAEFVPGKNANGKFCSRSCGTKARAGTELARAISAKAGKKRGDAMRGRGEGRSYRKRDGRHEHRIVAERKLGRALLPGEIVHHIDGNRLNNNPDNLAVMTQADHIRIHKPSRWKREAA